MGGGGGGGVSSGRSGGIGDSGGGGSDAGSRNGGGEDSLGTRGGSEVIVAEIASLRRQVKAATEVDQTERSINFGTRLVSVVLSVLYADASQAKIVKKSRAFASVV